MGDNKQLQEATSNQLVVDLAHLRETDLFCRCICGSNYVNKADVFQRVTNFWKVTWSKKASFSFLREVKNIYMFENHRLWSSLSLIVVCIQSALTTVYIMEKRPSLSKCSF